MNYVAIVVSAGTESKEVLGSFDDLVAKHFNLDISQICVQGNRLQRKVFGQLRQSYGVHSCDTMVCGRILSSFGQQAKKCGWSCPLVKMATGTAAETEQGVLNSQTQKINTGTTSGIVHSLACLVSTMAASWSIRAHSSWFSACIRSILRSTTTVLTRCSPLSKAEAAGSE